MDCPVRMTMETQDTINILFALSGALGGWVLNNVRDAVNELRAKDADLGDKVQQIELVVAGTCVRRDEMKSFLDAIYQKLDKIETTLYRKYDLRDTPNLLDRDRT
jgi:hypothetical protein